ncbi:hypothetical protein EV560_112235 [Bosea sp. BK604]|nr:hypothetical protein EV560_112235 [Bosea sp. BK604]
MNGAMWSLSVEFQFYAAFAGVLFTLALIRFSPAHYRVALPAIAAVLFVLVLADRLGQLVGSDPVPLAFIDYLWRFRFDFMLLGVGLALLLVVEIHDGPIFAPLLLVMPMAWVSVSEDQLGPGLKPVLDGFTTPFMALCFLALVYLARTNNAFAGQGTLLYRIMLWIGDRSYSIYLLHFPVMALAWMGIARFAPSIFNGAISYGVTQVVLVIPMTFLAANFSFEKVEGPFRRYGERWLTANARGR